MSWGSACSYNLLFQEEEGPRSATVEKVAGRGIFMARKGRVYVVAGPSGAGKGTLLRQALEGRDVHLTVSVTTRPPRPGEVDGGDYRFATGEEFDRLVAADAFLEWKDVYGNRYGTLRSEVEEHASAGRDVVLEIDVKGALEVKAKLPGARLIFIAPPSLEELEARLRGRDADLEPDIRTRSEVAPWEIDVGKREFDAVIVNDDVRQAAAELARELGR